MDRTFIIEEIRKGCGAVRRLRPLVHMIPNYVTAGVCADAIAAIGGRPLMAAAPEEMEEITGSSDGLVINLGQPSEEKFRACRVAMDTAAKKGLPVLFDPVGAGASAYRREMTGHLTEAGWSGVIKGNSSEIHTVLTGSLSHSGVDSVEEFENTSLSREFLNRMDRDGRALVLASTGTCDRIFWSRGPEAEGTIAEISLKHDSERKVVMVGTGCIAGALAGTLLAAERLLQGKLPEKNQTAILTAGAIALVSWAGEGIMTTKYGTYREELLNRISSMEESDFYRYLENRLEWKEG